MIQLDGMSLTVEDVVAVSRGQDRVGLSAAAIEAMNTSRRFVETAMRGTQPVYALNTGGLPAHIALAPSEVDQMQGSTTPLLEEAIRRFRTSVPGWIENCILSIPMERASEFIASGELNSIEAALVLAVA